MQQQPIYKTAAELKIEPWEHDGLVALVGPLSRGELRVYMRNASFFDTCGTAHCIGGWIATARKVYPTDYVNSDASRALAPLFYPGGVTYDTGYCDRYVCSDTSHKAWSADASQAARAIVNFLTLGDPRWDDVMRESSDAVRDTMDALNASYVADFDADDSGATVHAINEVA